jgi:hypothetical protein
VATPADQDSRSRPARTACYGRHQTCAYTGYCYVELLGTLLATVLVGLHAILVCRALVNVGLEAGHQHVCTIAS